MTACVYHDYLLNKNKKTGRKLSNKFIICNFGLWKVLVCPTIYFICSKISYLFTYFVKKIPDLKCKTTHDNKNNEWDKWNKSKYTF